MTDTTAFMEQAGIVQNALEEGFTGPLAPVAEQIGEAYANETQVRYDAEGNGEWAPLTPGTLRRKAEKGYPEWILYATGALRASMVLGGLDNIYTIEPLTITYGTSVDYASDHQYGEIYLPVREILVMPSESLQSDSCDWLNNTLCELANAA